MSTLDMLLSKSNFRCPKAEPLEDALPAARFLVIVSDNKKPVHALTIIGDETDPRAKARLVVQTENGPATRKINVSPRLARAARDVAVSNGSGVIDLTPKGLAQESVVKRNLQLGYAALQQAVTSHAQPKHSWIRNLPG